MAYRVKYTTGLFTRDGHTFEVTISQRDYTGGSQQIGTIKDVRLELQGGQSAIDSPILKTSLVLTWADASDLSTTGSKCGGFEEFYTPDSTLYLVTLYRDSREAWSGYLTPDAWSENLAHHTYIGITARDNIGHLQDFPFNIAEIQGSMTDGMVSLEQLVSSALSVVSCPMQVRFVSATSWLRAGINTALYDFLFDPHVYDGKTWYDALESALEDFGAVMRYAGDNTLWVAPLRYIQRMGRNSAPAAKGCTFVGSAAVRTLDPAYKQAIDKGQYELAPDYLPTFGANDWSTAGVLNKSGWSEYPVGTAKRMVYDFGGDRVADVTRCLYLRVYPDDERAGASLSVSRPTAIGSSVHVYANVRNLYYGDSQSPFPANQIFPHDCYKKVHLDYRLVWDADSPLVYNGYSWVSFEDAEEQWTNRQTYGWRGNQIKGYTWEDAAPIDLTITTPDTQGVLVLEMRAWGEDYSETQAEPTANWVRIDSVAIEVDGTQIPNGWKITTDYDLAQNTIVTHDATLGIVPEWITSAGAIKNGIYLRSADSRGATALRDAFWADKSSTSAPFPVFVGLQRLALHSTAFSVFTGELMANDGYIDFSQLYTIYDRRCMLVSGTLNLMTSRVENAVLREFDTYDEVFGTISTIPYECITDGEGNYGNNTSATGSGSSSGGGSGAGGGVSSYNQLSGKPSIDGVTLNGEMASYDDLRLMGREFFEKVNIGTAEHPVWAIHFFTPLYSDGTISAGGVASQGQGGGGSNVQWTQIVSEGSHIANITINGVTTQVYAPAGGGGNVSWGSTSGAQSVALIVDGVSKRLALATHTHTMQDDITDGEEWFDSMITAWQDGTGEEWVNERVSSWIDGWIDAEGEEWLAGHNFALASDIPTLLSQLAGDSSHRVVTDTQIAEWNGKLDSEDLAGWLQSNNYLTRMQIVALVNGLMGNYATYTEVAALIESELQGYATLDYVDSAVDELEDEIAAEQRIARKLQPSGSAIPANANLNTAMYAKVGSFYCAQDVTAASLTNCPTTQAFILENINPLSKTLDDEGAAYTYRVRIITDRAGRMFVQQANTGSSAGVWTWQAWKQLENNRDEFTWFANRIFDNAKYLQWRDNHGTNRLAMFLDGSNAFQIGRGIADAGYNTYLDGNSVKLRAGSTHSTILDIATNKVETSANFEPSVRDVYDLGSTTQRYKTAYVNEIVLTNGTHSVKLELDANGLLKINGSAYATGNLAAGGVAIPNE